MCRAWSGRELCAGTQSYDPDGSSEPSDDTPGGQRWRRVLLAAPVPFRFCTNV